MTRARSLRIALLLGALCALGVAAACSGDGVNANCPPQPLYQTFPLGDASAPDATSGDTAAVKEALAASVAAGCATGPSGAGASVAGAAGKGGSSGAGGNSGSSVGGKSGSGGKSGVGEGGVDNAGAAGRN